MATPRENHELAQCFACGPANPRGLMLRFITEAGTAVAETRCCASWVSWRGIIHGGILAAMMDEAMGYAVATHGWTGLTARLTVDLHLPVAPGQHLTVRAWVERWRRRLARTAAELVTPNGTVVARARAHVLLVQELPSVELHG